MTSSERILSNNLVSIELASDKRIQNSDYYIVRIVIDGVKRNKLIDAAEELCKGNIPKYKNTDSPPWTPPIVAYICDNEIQLLFSTTEEEHNLGGSHQKICSILTSALTLYFGKPCQTSIIELANRVLILCYFQCKICSYSQNKMASLLPKKHSAKAKFKTLTLSEQIHILKEENIEWADFENYEKYGTFIKIERGILKQLSKNINFSNKEEHEEFLFE